MSNEDSSSEDSENNVPLDLILRAAQVLDTESSGAAAIDEAGPSGTQQQQATDSSNTRGQPVYLHVEDGSDDDLHADNAEHLDAGSTQSDDSHVTSQPKSNAVTPGVTQKPRAGRGRGRGGRGRPARPSSYEDMVRRQQVASQTHNESERLRRKEMRTAVVSLRNQLTRPTKRAAVKMVLEAAKEELEELKAKESESVMVVEALTDKRKMLSFELKHKIEEYEKHRQAVIDGNPPPPTTPGLPLIIPRYPQAVPLSPMTRPGVLAPIFNPSQTVRYPTPLEPSMVSPRHQLFARPRLFLPGYIPQPTSQEQPLLNTPLAMLSNASPSLPHTPVLSAPPRINFHPSMLSSFPALYPSLVPQSVPTYPVSLPTLQRIPASPMQVTSLLRYPNSEALSNLSGHASAMPLRNEEPQRVATIVSPGSRVLTIPSLYRTVSDSATSSPVDGPPSVRRERLDSIIVDNSIPIHNTGSSEDGQDDVVCVSPRGDHGYLREETGSKNETESAETESRPFSVVQCITTADSNKRPATDSIDSSNAEPASIECTRQRDNIYFRMNVRDGIRRGQMDIERAKPAYERARLSSSLAPTPPPLSSDHARDIKLAVRKVPPLLKISNDSEPVFSTVYDSGRDASQSLIHYTGINEEGAKLLQINMSESSSEVRATGCGYSKYRNRVNRRNGSIFSRAQNGFRKRPRRTSDTDSESNEEELSSLQAKRRKKEALVSYASRSGTQSKPTALGNKTRGHKPRQVLTLQSVPSSNHDVPLFPLKTMFVHS